MSKATKAYKEHRPWCEVSVCPNGSDHVHHIRTRGAWGGDEDTNLLALCAYHHDYIHKHGVETCAKEWTHLRKKIRAALDAPRN